MATEEGDGGMEDVERSLEADDRHQEGGFFSSVANSLGNAKDRWVDFHTVPDEESDRWGDQQAVNGISRRGVLAGVGELAVAGYAVTEATDNDGWTTVDWSSGEEPGFGVGPGNGNGEGPSDQNGAAAADGNQLGVQGDVSDELYLQDDGTVIAIDYGHKEWRKFSPDNFPENSDFSGLYDEVSEERDETDLAPPGLGSGVEVSKDELFNYDTSAYEDMADEAEWDLIFDHNPNYGGGE